MRLCISIFLFHFNKHDWNQVDLYSLLYIFRVLLNPAQDRSCGGAQEPVASEGLELLYFGITSESDTYLWRFPSFVWGRFLSKISSDHITICVLRLSVTLAFPVSWTINWDALATFCDALCTTYTYYLEYSYFLNYYLLNVGLVPSDKKNWSNDIFILTITQAAV